VAKWKPASHVARPAHPEDARWAALSTASTDKLGIVASNTNFLSKHKASIHAEAARRVGNLFCYHCLFQASEADLERVRRDYRESLLPLQPTLADAPPPRSLHDDLRTARLFFAWDSSAGPRLAAPPASS